MSTNLSPAIEHTYCVSGALYDFSGLGKLAKNAEFVRGMQQLFVERVPGQLAQLHATLENQDWRTMAQRAHSLKSTFGTLKIEPSADLLNQIERIAIEQGDTNRLEAMLRVIITATDAVVSLFQQELNRAA